MNTKDVVALSLDELSLDAAVALAEKVGSRVYALKVHDLYDRHGAQVLQKLKQAGASRVWVDAKLHDIPNTVRARAKALSEAGTDIITVHASGGKEMLIAAKEGAGTAEVYAVTVLTSLSKEDVYTVYGTEPVDAVIKFAGMAEAAGVDGLVCSPQEVPLVHETFPNMKLVVPGIRSVGKDAHDQKRTGTPLETLSNGASCLVIGRQITLASDPVAALDELAEELSTS